MTGRHSHIVDRVIDAGGAVPGRDRRRTSERVPYNANVAIVLQTGDGDRLGPILAEAKDISLDGITVTYPNWWANVRPSNTEPFLRMCLEADTPELMAEKKQALFDVLGTPVDH